MVKIAFSLLVVMISTIVPARAAKLNDPLRPVKYTAQAGVTATAQKAQATAQQNLQLGAILFSETRAVAVINGQSLQVGDSLEGYRLTRIKRGQVVLQSEKKRVVLRRPGSGLKKVTAVAVTEKKGTHSGFVKLD